jgi:hypothetical protein
VNTTFERAESRGQTIFQFDPGATGAVAFRDLARELLDICGLAKDAPEKPKERTTYDQLHKKGQTPRKSFGGAG